MTHRLKTTPITCTLLTALLMAGCAQQSATPAPTVTTPPATTPTTPGTTAQPARPVLTAGRTYELQFKRDGQGKLVSSSVVTAGQLSAQATRMTDAPLAFSYVSSGTLNMNGQWYVRVTYHVTNNSAQAISNLGFVPLDTDAAPAVTPSTAPTVGATYFKDVKHFDGSDASDQAAALVPGQARDASGAVDSTATPYVPIDTSGLGVNLPTGLVLGTGGLSGSGWQTGGTLAPGASTDVTFATQMPAVSGTADPFFYTVVFTAVSSVNVPVAIAPQAGANPNVNLPASGPAYVTGTIGDPTDPASVQGLKFTVAASDADAAGLSVTATSSDLSMATVSLSGSGANRTLKIAPQKVGYADITVTVADGTRASASYTIKYAASQAAGATASTRFFSGASNASSAQDLGGGYMLVADDEFNTLNLYPTTTSSAPLAKFDFTSNLNLTDTANPEIDLEASARLGNRIFWMGSESNSKKGATRTNRDRVFATDVSGSGAATTLSYVGYYGKLKEDLLAWDAANGNVLGLNASAASGVIPETDGGVGYNIEGLAFKPGTSTAYIGFRAPLETTSSRNLALIVPVTNFADLVTGAASSATFAAPIQLDLGGRAIRELKCNDQGCLILAGPATGGSNFALYSWSGNVGDAPHLRNDLQSLAISMDGSLESIVNLPAGNPDSDALTGQTLQLLTDNGDSVFYGDGTGAKDLVGPAQDWQKFRAENVTVGAMPAQSCTVNGLTITPNSPTLTVGGTQNFTTSYTTTPSNCTTSVSWSSSDPSVLSITSAGQASAVATGSAIITATVTPGSGTPVSATTTATVNAPSGPVTSLPNVSVYRVGDGSTALTNTGNAVFVDTYNGNDGTLVGTVALPTAASNKPLIASGTAASEGLLSRSADGHYLLLTGYGTTPPYSASLSGTKSSAVPRTIGRIDAAGNVDTTTSLTDAVSGNNPRSVASADGSSFYIAGGAGGVNYAPLGATTSTNIIATPANLRQLNIYGGQLYASSGSGTGTKGVMSIGSGLPTTPGQTATRLPGLSDTLTADSYGYYFADLDGTPGVDTLYVADGTAANGLQKFSLQNGSWVASGAASGKYVGLTGVQQGGSVTLFATSATGTQLVKLTDASGYLGTFSATPTVLTTAKTNTALRGVALAPTP